MFIHSLGRYLGDGGPRTLLGPSKARFPCRVYARVGEDEPVTNRSCAGDDLRALNEIKQVWEGKGGRVCDLRQGPAGRSE